MVVEHDLARNRPRRGTIYEVEHGHGCVKAEGRLEPTMYPAKVNMPSTIAPSRSVMSPSLEPRAPWPWIHHCRQDVLQG